MVLLGERGIQDWVKMVSHLEVEKRWYSLNVVPSESASSNTLRMANALLDDVHVEVLFQEARRMVVVGKR